ncbi:MAG: 5-formyltetrahydrofolate cyclo-ligase [Fibrobacter sp.]|jgi:5-formyltetrahydrofolate cyclo-ligase|uniref:5-formyltetrahydrofolate cyclo-ligase n=1 Tax=Fibrobacter sp. UWP2 TaxID=1896216 RepID=UPI00092036E5|nr:5-formyltetrahydrofolate cyclo-ligase [Fibrobacter sp. UWP2]MBO7383713.1 5-formyltetrahydrofolate cyclo-ligase [Fibrobacter sp.]SHI76836.1 5-formyltetrahydrofolate cyclo-ligase [Fibrobacter sp. UWP2]
MDVITAIAVFVLVTIVFGSSQIVDLILKKRREKKGEDIIQEPWQQIHDIPGYRDSRNIAAFYPVKGEPNLMPVVEELAMEGRLLLPRCEGDGIMNFYKIQNLKKDLVKGHFGIMEPREGLEKFEGEIPVFLVPGTKFTWDGCRQGHGKGYYDRFLAKFPKAYKAGIATPAQISKEPLEQKETDIKMDVVIACREKG